MKSKHILLLSILLSQTFPVQGMEPDNEEPHEIHHQAAQPADNVALLRQEITHMREKFKQHAALLANPDKVIIIGPSGGGKSTLVHYYAGVPLVVKEKPSGELYIDLKNLQDLLPGLTIRHDTLVGTKAPCPWHDPKSNRVYWDCPGFGDPRGPVADIVNALAIHQIFTASSKSTVILTIPYEELKGRASKFKALFNHVAEFFPESKQLEEDLYLAVTKKEPRIKIEEKLKEILHDSTSKKTSPFSARAQELVSYFIENNANRIVCFDSPRDLGDYKPNENRPSFPSKRRTELGVTIALTPEARHLIEQLATELNTEICQRINAQIKGYVIESVKNHMGLARGLRNNLRHFFASFDEVPADPLSWGHLWYQKFYDDYVSTRIEDINFLKSIHRSVKCNIGDWKKAIHAALGSFYDYSVDPKIIFEEGILKLTGSLIGTSDIQDESKDRPDIKSIEAEAKHKLFIDQNVKFPSVHLTLNAPKWTVIDKKTIDISGSEGLAHNPPKAGNGIEISNDRPLEFHKRNGKDGEKGLPGGHGGNFTGKGQVENLDGLMINISGGKGGKGQDGGDGANGRDGKEGSIEEVRNRELKALVERKEELCPRFVDFNHQIREFEIAEVPVLTPENFVHAANGRFIETYVSGMRGEKGGEAGKKGEGGDGGQRGIARINDKTPHSDMLQNKNGEKGVDGSIGINGREGKGGKVYRGIYKTEDVLSDLRKNSVNEGKKISVPRAVAKLSVHNPKEGAKAVTLAILGSASANAYSSWLEEPHEVEEEAIPPVNEGQKILPPKAVAPANAGQKTPAPKAAVPVNEGQKILPPKAVAPANAGQKTPAPKAAVPVNEGQKILPPKAVAPANAGQKTPAPKAAVPVNEGQKILPPKAVAPANAGQKTPAPKAVAPANAGQKTPAPKAVAPANAGQKTPSPKAVAPANAGQKTPAPKAVAPANAGQKTPAPKAVAPANAGQKILLPKAVPLVNAGKKNPAPKAAIPVNEGQKILPPKAVPLVNAGKKNPAPKAAAPVNEGYYQIT